GTLTLLSWPLVARIARSAVYAVKQADYVQAARALGASPFRIMFRHLLPNALAPVIVYGSLMVATFISAEATLSFLGVGLRPPVVSWGVAIPEAGPSIRPGFLLTACPTAFWCITVLAFVMLGDAVRDALDPKLRSEFEAVTLQNGDSGDYSGPLLEVEHLEVKFHTRAGIVKAVNDVSFTVDSRETLAVLGESGSGKSVTAQTIMGILDMPPAVITGGAVRFRGTDLLTLSEPQRRAIR